MMNTQVTSATSRLAGGDDLRVLHGGRVVPLGSRGGKLEVLHGRVWLTRAGDRDDHFVDFGHAIVVPASGRALVESVDDDRPAVIVWRPGTIVDRAAAALHAAFDRCFHIVEPRRRVGVGALAAVAALALGALLFGPVSDARTRSLATAAVLHNSAAPKSAAAPARSGPHVRSTTARGAPADVGAEPRERAGSVAQEARRRPAGVA